MQHFDSWDKLRTILAVADTGSYRAASRVLGYSSATVARHIEAVTHEVGFPLFVARGNHWELTFAGRELVRIASETQSSLSTAIKNIQNKVEIASRVEITTLSFISSYFLSKHISLWEREFPSASLSINASDNVFSVEKGEADIALRLGRPVNQGVTRFKVADCPVGIFAHLGKHSRDWIGLPEELDQIPDMQLAYEFFACKPKIRLDSFTAIANASLDSGLSCVLPTCVARQFSQLSLVVPDQHRTTVKRELWFLYHEKRKNDPVIDAGRKWIKRVFPSSSRCLCGYCR